MIRILKIQAVRRSHAAHFTGAPGRYWPGTDTVGTGPYYAPRMRRYLTALSLSLAIMGLAGCRPHEIYVPPASSTTQPGTASVSPPQATLDTAEPPLTASERQ